MSNYVKLRIKADPADSAWRPGLKTSGLFVALGAGLLGLAAWSLESGANGGTVAGVFGAFLLACGVKVAADVVRRLRAGPPPDAPHEPVAAKGLVGQDRDG